MKKAAVLETLRAHEAELKAVGIVHLRLFGSVAREEEDAGSDVDLMVDFDDTVRLSMWKQIGVKHRLEEMLGVKVDLAQANLLREHVKPRAMRDAETAF